MDSKQLLLSSINLMYLESKLSDTTHNSRDLARQASDFVEMPENNLGSISLGGNFIQDIKSVADWMLGKPEDYAFDPSSIIQKIKSAHDVSENFVGGITQIVKPLDMSKEEDSKFVFNMIEEIKDDLSSFIINLNINDVVRKAARDIEFSRDPKKAIELARELMIKIEPLTHNTSNGIPEGVVDIVDLGDPQATTDMISQAVEDINMGGILKTDIQLINRMFEGGFWPGKTYLVPALQHNFKSGMMLTIIRGIISCNKPVLINKSKKPLILRISSENTSKDDVMWLYKNLMEIETGKKIDIRNVDPEVAGNYISKWVNDSGFHFINYKVNPSTFNTEKTLNLLAKLRANGYEIKLFLLDYLAMLDKKGLSGGNDSDRIRDMFRRVRNDTEANKETFITPHQISTDAKKLKRADNIGVGCFVKEVTNKGYTDGCTRIDQEVDGEMYMDITKMKHDGKSVSYLELARGKHRIPIITPEKDLYGVLRFHEIGTILPDINGKDSSLSRPGGDYIPVVDVDDF